MKHRETHETVFTKERAMRIPSACLSERAISFLSNSRGEREREWREREREGEREREREREWRERERAERERDQPLHLTINKQRNLHSTTNKQRAQFRSSAVLL
jgi:hypothetical protein